MTNINLGKRTIVQIKYSHLTTLPLVWIKRHKLTRGKRIEFELTPEGTLVLKPVKENETHETA